MLSKFKDKIALSGITILAIGVFLLIFTFANAYGFIVRGISISHSADLVQTFGGALAPLIETCINLMYLGVMGWIGSLLTVRGVTIVTRSSQTPIMPSQQPNPDQKPTAPVQPQKIQSDKSRAKTVDGENRREEDKAREQELITVPLMHASRSERQ